VTPKTKTDDYKDRSTGLVLFGVLEILMGVAAGFMGVCILLVSSFIKIPNAPPTPWVGSLFYLGIAVSLIWLGVGSTQARRWARALLLVLSWMWLVMGVVAGVTLLVIMPTILDHLGDTMPSSGEANFVKWFTMIFLGMIFLVIYVLIPGVLVLFYRSPHVKATCEAKDPQTRWTDLCPLPVLAMSLFYGFGLLAIALVMPIYGFVFPFFGTLISGLTGALATGVTLVLMAYLCWGFYKLKTPAWWVAMGFSVVGYGSALLTFSRVGLLGMYQMMNFPPETIENIRKTGLLDSNFMVIELAVGAVLVLGYLVFVKRYFKDS
jgi:MFS family permease